MMDGTRTSGCGASRRPVPDGSGHLLARLVLIVCVAVGAGAAQLRAQQTYLRGDVAFQQYEFDDPDATGVRSLSLLSVPLAAVVSLTDNATLEVHGGFARGTLESVAGDTIEISGLTDTELRLGFRLPGTLVFRVQGIGIIQTGHVSHTPEEALVAGAVAADLLPFRISNWGSGGGFGGHASLAGSFGDTGLGVSASFIRSQEFEPLAEQPFQYQPGDRLRVRAALDRNMGSSSKFTLTLTMERYSEDALDGSNLYRAGDRLYGVASYAFQAGGSGSGLVYGGVFHRTEGTALLEAAPSVPSQQLFLAGGGLRVPIGSLVLVPSVDTRLFRSDDGVGQGWLTGAGAALELRVGELSLAPSARARFGNVLVREGVESGVSGLELSLTSRFGR